MSEGPCYGVELLDKLPLFGTMQQQLPSRDDLERVREVSDRTVAGYEVLLHHYYDRRDYAERLRAMLLKVIEGDWCVTDIQEAIGHL